MIAEIICLGVEKCRNSGIAGIVTPQPPRRKKIIAAMKSPFRYAQFGACATDLKWVKLASAMKRTTKIKTGSPGDATVAIHAGEDRFHVGVPVGTSIARTANFTFASTEEMKRWAEGKSSAYIYSRYGNPTLAIAEAKIAALEGAEAAVVTASGMAAISSALLTVLKAGDEVISTRQTYGGTYRLMRDVFPRMAIVVRHVESDLAGIERLPVAGKPRGRRIGNFSALFFLQMLKEAMQAGALVGIHVHELHAHAFAGPAVAHQAASAHFSARNIEN